MIKSNYMNTQNKWQENNAKWFIELKKYILRESVFKKFQRIFFKKQFSINDFNLFIYKKKLIYFLNFICIQFSKKIFTLIVFKEFITKFQLGQKNYFYLLLLKINEFLQFYLQKYFNLFSFKKSDLYKLFKQTWLYLQKKF